MSVETVIAIVGSITGSAALFGFIQFLISRKDKKNEKLESIQKDITSIKTSITELKSDLVTVQNSFRSDLETVTDLIDKTNAIQSRIRILRANDEMRQDVHHSYEYFRQLHQDITEYELYCTNHPEFKNNEAVNSIEYINRVYQDCLESHNFLS